MKGSPINDWCVCRNCGANYQEHKSRADFKGFCSQSCLGAKAHALGYRKSKEGPYKVLKEAGEIGSVFK